MTTKKEDREAAVEGGVNRRGEPDVIWMQIYDDDDPANARRRMITCWWEHIFDHDVMYVRADLAATDAWQAVDVTEALKIAEAALADIGDADREPGDDIAWAERRAAEALPKVRAALLAALPGDSKNER